MNSVYQILKYILNLLWRETEKQRKTDRDTVLPHQYIIFAYKPCQASSPEMNGGGGASGST